jgi:DHA1 family multidrug resistance protein-like MFS transporter
LCCNGFPRLIATRAFGITCYTAGIQPIIKDFNITMTQAILGMSLYLFGITFAPVWTPHVTERTGRSLVYLCSLPICGLFLVGAGVSRTFAGVAICRFLAGFAGGPCLVLIEGTFADIWSAETTNTYYAFLGTAAYIGAACGPIAGGYVVTAYGWRWTQYLSCIVIAAALLLVIGMPESYLREIPRRRARQACKPIHQDPAQSGVTISQMIRITVLDPVRMLFTEPIVALTSVMLIFNFAVVFQWFITVPAVLSTVYGFDIERIGLAFITAIVGALLAAVCNIAIEQISTGMLMKNRGMSMAQTLEYRLVPAMIGQFLVTASLFWIGKFARSFGKGEKANAHVGWTAMPQTAFEVPVIGTAVYVWGNAMIVFSLVPYLFDAYPPAATLSALTVAASGRIFFAGGLALVIIQDFTGIGGKWALSIFGFISIALWPVPFALFRYGKIWRENSRFVRASQSAQMLGA